MKPPALRLGAREEEEKEEEEEEEVAELQSLTFNLSADLLSGILLCVCAMEAQARLVCLLLLCSTCVLCSVVSREQRVLEELLRGLLTAQNQGAPYWPTSLASLCRTLGNRPQDASSNEEEEEGEEEDEEGVQALMEENAQLLQEVYKLQNLQHLCGTLQGWGKRLLLLDSLKRKSPYILKRQTGRSSKSRRPYILKRRALY